MRPAQRMYDINQRTDRTGAGLCLVLTLLLTGCGQTGGLYLPGEEPTGATSSSVTGQPLDDEATLSEDVYDASQTGEDAEAVDEAVPEAVPEAVGETETTP